MDAAGGLIHECRTAARDEVATMFCKRMAVIHKKGEERLTELHEAYRAAPDTSARHCEAGFLMATTA